MQQFLEQRQYVPSMAGILLSQNNSRIVGVVVNDHEKYEGRVLEDTFIASSLNALLYELEKNGYFMMVKATTEWNEIIRFASMWNMDGLVLIGFCDSDYEKLRDNMHIPFVVSDVYAIELMQFAQANGIQVPKQLSIVGFDNIGLCEKVHPTLTTVGQNPARRAGGSNRQRDRPDCSLRCNIGTFVCPAAKATVQNAFFLQVCPRRARAVPRYSCADSRLRVYVESR